MYKKILDLLIAGYRKVKGKNPEGIDLLKVKMEAAERAREQAKIIQFPSGGRDRVPVEKQFGGIQSLDEFKKMEDVFEKSKKGEATRIIEKDLNVKLYGDETFDELEQIRKTGKHPRGEPEDFAMGGRVGFASGKLARLKKRYRGSTLEAILENPKLMGAELGYEGLAELFRLFGLKEGGPADPKRRQVLKIMGGLAALPYVGKFFKLAEPAAKVAPVVKESVTKAPDYFFALVDKIKKFGKPVDDVAVDPRVEKNYTYKNYELRENAYGTSGDITVVKQKGDPDFAYEEEIMTFRKGQADEITKGKKPPDEYEEFTVKPDMDGKMKDVEDGIEPEGIQEIVEEVSKKTPSIKKADGGLARMLGM